MIWVTLEVSTGGSLTNLEKVWNPGAQRFTSRGLTDNSVIKASNAFSIACSRVASWVPSWPSDLNPNCFNNNPPASLTSNSANLRLVAPKSTARNDLFFSIYQDNLIKYNLIIIISTISSI